MGCLLHAPLVRNMDQALHFSSFGEKRLCYGEKNLLKCNSLIKMRLATVLYFYKMHCPLDTCAGKCWFALKQLSEISWQILVCQLLPRILCRQTWSRLDISTHSKDSAYLAELEAALSAHPYDMRMLFACACERALCVFIPYRGRNVGYLKNSGSATPKALFKKPLAFSYLSEGYGDGETGVLRLFA